MAFVPRKFIVHSVETFRKSMGGGNIAA